jgi:tight adherence protein B
VASPVRGARLRFAARLRAAGIDLTPREFLGLSAGAALGGALLAQGTLGWPMVSLVAGAGAGALPYAVFLQRAARRRAAIQQALVEAVAQLRDAIRVGHSQQQALVFLATDGPEVLQRQFNRLALDIQTGGFARALTRWQADLADPLADQVAEALRIANRKGGERLSDVLQRLVETTRADFRIRQQIRAMQTQGVWQARLICAMPLFILVAMRRINPAAMAIFDRPVGQLILAGSALWLLVGYLWMLAAIRVRQPNRLFVPEYEEVR